MAPESSTRPLLAMENDDRVPVLLPLSSSSGASSGAQGLTSTQTKDVHAATWLPDELLQLFQLAGPMILVSLLQFLITVVSLMFVGHLGELELSGSSIASTFAVVTGPNIMMGMACAVETLCGQAYGAKEYRLTGIFLQRAVFVLTLVGIPISIVWWNMAPILKLMGQDPAISDVAQEYSRYLVPILFAYAFLQPMVKFLQTQSVVNAMAVFSVITLIVHALLCYLLIYPLGVGFRGAAIANGISQWLNVLFLVLYIKFSPSCKKTWRGLSMEAVEDIYPFLQIAVPSAIMFCLKFCCFNSLVLISGLLPNPQLETSTLAICLSILGIMYSMPFGLSAAVSTLVSNKVGAGLPFEAKAAVNLTVTLALIEGCTLAILLISMRDVFPYLFSSDADVVKYVSSMVPFVASIAIMDTLQTTLCGVARGCGWQNVGAYISLCAYYVIGIPMALLMAFYFHLHGYGLWIGMNCGMVTQAFLLSWITLRLDWQKVADDAAELVSEAKSLWKTRIL
ncbi:hypothetical protein R1flu_016681 [Riccia fluitans]|uniref:Protein DETOXIFICATION n=1 Tax=Riccia fluitans TaxID=41844 RepID=A0ABD1YMV7_9MARC